MRAPLLLVLALVPACGSDAKSGNKMLPDGFLVQDRDAGMSPPADLSGADLARGASDLAPGSGASDLASASMAAGTTADTCAQAVMLQSGVQLTGDTTGLHDDYNFGTTSSPACEPELGTPQYQGADAAYVIAVPVGKTLTVTVTPSQLPTAFDPAVALVGDCGVAGPTCLAGHDGVLASDPETASWTNSGAASKTVYVIVDSALSGFQDQGVFTILAVIN
jgi:hypothetical protein